MTIYEGVVVLSIRQDKLKQFSMKYLFRKDKAVYYLVFTSILQRSVDGEQGY